MVSDAVRHGLQEGLRAALLNAGAKLLAIMEETASKMKQVTQGMSEMTTKFTESTTKYQDMLVRSPPGAMGWNPTSHSWGQGSRAERAWEPGRY